MTDWPRYSALVVNWAFLSRTVDRSPMGSKSPLRVEAATLGFGPMLTAQADAYGRQIQRCEATPARAFVARQQSLYPEIRR
jgi:hypothetical protein